MERCQKESARVFRSETSIVGILGRTELDGPDDTANVRAIQAQYRITPLHSFADSAAPKPAPVIAFPPYDQAKATNHDFIIYLNFLLQFAERPPPGEANLMQRFAKIGIGPGRTWDAAKVEPDLLAAVDAGVADAQTAMKAVVARTRSSNGLFGTREFLDGDYMKRAVAAAMGLYGNSLEEAWYGGYEGDGTSPRVIHFAAGQTPPARFFWSITLYTLPERFLYANEINRYSIGDRTKGLIYSKDGSLTIYVSHDSPGNDKETNWLPAPAGPYSLVVRAYGPQPAMTDGQWKLPQLETTAASHQ